MKKQSIRWQLYRPELVTIALFIALLGLPRVLGCQSEQTADTTSLELTLQKFLSTVGSGDVDTLMHFFPVEGTLSYRHTIYLPGEVRQYEWRFPAEELRDAVEGPLWPVFHVQWEGQPIGYFAHQVLAREGRWRAVHRTRFIPPDGNPSSNIYVEWRREGSKWVISELADEFYPSPSRSPEWCC